MNLQWQYIKTYSLPDNKVYFLKIRKGEYGVVGESSGLNCKSYVR